MSAGESILTENCYKFTQQSIESMLREAGMVLDQWHTDPAGLYAVALATPIQAEPLEAPV